MLKFIFTVVLIIQSCWAFSVQPTLDARVTDGHDAQPGEFPYQVSLQWGIPPFIDYRHICGATLVSENYIVTAAHCVLRIGKLRAVVGKHKMHVQDMSMEQMSEISVRFVHPDYKGGVAPYDIALLKMKTPVKFTEYVKAVTLPKQDEMHTGTAVLTGWGSISKKFLPIMPKVLQVAKVPILDQKICKEALYGFSTQATLYDSQVCSGPLGSSISACSGDSGGPLVQYQDNTPVLVGIVSWGFYPCGSSGAPSVYTRVSSFVDWIKPKMEYF